MGRARRKISFREAQPDDLAGLIDIERQCFRSYYRAHQFDESQFRYYLRLSTVIAEVALDHARPVGYALGVVQRGRRRGVARLYSLAVIASARRQGVGERLLHDFVTRARKRGARYVRLEVAVRNAPARRLFERAGFRTSRRLPDYYARGIDALLMVHEQ